MAKNITAMTKRGQYHKLVVALTGTLRDTYLDDMGNVQFKDFFLQQDGSENQIVEPQMTESVDIEEKKNRFSQSPRIWF